MEECFDLGLTKAIGLSNYNSQQIQRVLDNCKVKPACLQVCQIAPELLWMGETKRHAVNFNRGVLDSFNFYPD